MYKLRHKVETPKLNAFSRVPKSSELLGVQDALRFCGFELGANLITFSYNVNCKRTVTFKSFNTGCFGGYESVQLAT